jgi:Tfp pilus assembly protein PilP
MAKKNKHGLINRIAMIGVPLIIIELGYVAFFNQNKTVTVQQAIDKAVKKINGVDERRKAMLKIQLAITDYMQKNEGKAPATLDELRPTYFDVIPLDPETKQPFLYKVENKRPLVGYNLVTELARNNPILSKKLAKAEAVERPEIELEKISFVYDPTGKRDPFRPFDLGPKPSDLAGKTPLERYDYGQLKLTAVLKGFDQPQAIVENAVGKGFTVKIGTKIGTGGGEVVEILPDRILILENIADFTGEKKTKTFELKLRTKDQDDNR